MDLLLGAKYYRYIGDEIELVRVYKYNNDLEVTIYNDTDKNDKRKITISELKDKYVQLKPHAVVNFCIAKVGNDLDDVIVLMHKMSDLTSNEPTPYCTCRQNITDVFANQIKVSNKMYVGCSMSLDTCPPDVDYRVMMACNGINKSISVYAYMDDTLDDILNMVNTKDYDRTLESLFRDHVNYEAKSNPAISMMKERIMKLESYNGYCKTLKLLLEHNNFMYDFYQAFKIIPVTFEVSCDKDRTVDPSTTNLISDIYQVNIISTLCLPYGYDIDLDEIDNDYVLIMDKNNKLYVIAYVSNGPKHIDVENVESEENIERMANSTIAKDKSVKEAIDYIRINKNKYN